MELIVSHINPVSLISEVGMISEIKPQERSMTSGDFSAILKTSTRDVIEFINKARRSQSEGL